METMKCTSCGETVLPISASVWIFQADPQRYEIIEALKDDKIGEEIHWSVNQHKKEIKKGHTGIIWQSGEEAGIYAITKILTDPTVMEEPDAEREYWSDPEDEKGERLRVKMRIIKKMLSSPLLREKIKSTTGLQNMFIIKCAQGTNFPVEPDEWNIIRDLILNQ